MRLWLEHVDTRGLKLELSPDRAAGDQAVIVRSSAGLRGVLEQTAVGLKLSDVGADEVTLESLRLVFGSVVLEQEGGATLARLRVEVDKGTEGVTLDLRGDVRAERLAIEVGSIRIEAVAHIDGMRVCVNGDHGRIEAEHVELSRVSTRIGSVELGADTLVADRMVIAWGGGFRLEATGLDAPTLRVAAGDTSVQASEISASELAVHGARVTLDEAKIGDVAIESDFAPSTSEGKEEPEAAETKPSSKSKPFDWHLLDGLHGDLDVDLALDLTVPVIGRRRATHHFRIPIEAGALDFIRLENDLSTLENTLLDFAVRDRALVLERGIPLLPTRGRGKPIIVWKLSDEDLELAAKQRVRLAVLPGAQVAAEAESEERASKPERTKAPSVALRRLGLRNIDARLGLASVPETSEGLLGRLRFERLAVKGGVQHDPGSDPPPGHIEAELADLDAKLLGIPLGENRLHAEGVRLAHASDLAVSFAGLRPTALRLALTGLVLTRIELRED